MRIWILFSSGKNNIYTLAALVRKILFCHSKIKFISSRHHVISSLDSLDWLGFLDKSNLLKIPDCRSFSVLKTLTGYRPYGQSVQEWKTPHSVDAFEWSWGNWHYILPLTTVCLYDRPKTVVKIMFRGRWLVYFYFYFFNFCVEATLLNGSVTLGPLPVSLFSTAPT